MISVKRWLGIPAYRCGFAGGGFLVSYLFVGLCLRRVAVPDQLSGERTNSGLTRFWTRIDLVFASFRRPWAKHPHLERLPAVVTHN